MAFEKARSGEGERKRGHAVVRGERERPRGRLFLIFKI